MIDLQLHTTDSDGTWPWNRVLEQCKLLGLKAYAITDHDTVVRREEILDWAKKNNETAIPGVELSTHENGQTVHLLGYFLDGPLHRLNQRLEFLIKARLERNKKIVNRLQELGHPISVEEVKKVSGQGTMGRPHIARLLLEKGIVKSILEAFERFLAPNGAAYFPKEELPLKEGIELLRDSGAVSSVAHPGLLRRSGEQMEQSLKVWKEWGLDGIEAVYPAYSKQQMAFFDRMSSKYNFLKTGGSDFHGENKPHIKIGIGTGNFKVPDELLKPLFDKRDEIVRNLKLSKN